MLTTEEQWAVIKRLEKERAITLVLPIRFAFKDHGVHAFHSFLSFFDWSLNNRPVRIDLTNCKSANYQAVSLLCLYAWHLKNNGCRVSFIESDLETGAPAMWRRLGARGLFPVLFHESQNFNADSLKPLFAVRNSEDFKRVIAASEAYTKDFDVEYAGTLRYVIGELLYNTLEHGRIFAGAKLKKIRIPSIVQFTWYKKQNEIHFMIADIGIGIKKHIEQTYPTQESHEDAIKLAIKPQVSGTFGVKDPYTEKNNAGMGLYISTNIIRRLNADMHVISGDGLLHISPRDITGKTLSRSWPGTIVLVAIRLEREPKFVLHKIMQEFREAASAEQHKAEMVENDGRFYVSIYNYFGQYAEDKESAIKFRDYRLFKEVQAGKTIVIDFDNVMSAPHSFLSALLASPIKSLGMNSYKQIKIVNATPELRETIDFIFDDNT